MNDLKKPDLMTPEVIIKGLANVCGNLTPVHIPPPSYSSGIVPNFFKLKKVRQIRLIMEEVKLIEEARTATLKTQLDQAKCLTFYSEEIKTTFVKHETDREVMREKANQEIQVTARLAAISRQEDIRANIMYFEMKKAEMELKKISKELEVEYGTTTTQDRDE